VYILSKLMVSSLAASEICDLESTERFSDINQ
jgi:hypothetical protein